MMVGFVLLYPDKNIMVCCSKYNFSDLMAAILIFFYETPQGWELHIRPDITIGEPDKHNEMKWKRL